VENIKIPYLELSEQKSISLYLDDRTRKIDSLIEKKQKMIELLKEERAAVINQAVTKGLNPDAPMKDSGIECLGEVPEHWNIVRLKLISKIKYGLGEPPKQKEDGIPLIRATNIDRGKIIEKDLVLVDPKDVPYERDPVLKKDDIIVVRSGAYTADSAIIPQKYDGAIAGYDMVVRVVKASPKYIAFALLSQYVLINQLYLQRMRAAQPHLNAEEFGDTLILIPPKNEEQQAFIQLIESESAKIDSAVSIIKKEILLLQEYRTALISEVVTGKIDVRKAI
jgi:type I restriction enzyme S subunit